ncbi:Aldehyde/histidinol dehydrogenase [Aspergillus oleicola]
MADLVVELTAPNGVHYSQPTGLFINNGFVSASGQTITSIDPATDKPIATVHAARAADVDRAVNAAKAALVHPSWKKLPGADRGQLMGRLADLMEKNKDGWADKTFGQTISTTPQKFAYTTRQPLGPTLVCGNTVVLKPAEQTPLSILVFAKLVKVAGFPPGVVNIVNGLGREAGAALVSHQLVDKLAFTGSTMTAREIAAGTLKNITLETGGKSPLLVFSDADLDQAVKWSHFGIMSNQGQICTATSRIYVHQDISQEFLGRFKEVVETTSKIGDQWDESTFQGPQVTRVVCDRRLSHVSGIP